VDTRAPTAGHVPDEERFGAALCPATPSHRCLRQLHKRLAVVDDNAPLPARLAALEQLAHWVCAGPKPPPAATSPGQPAPSARLALLLRGLDAVPSWRERFAATVRSVLAETSSLHLLCEVGLPNDRGLVHETSDRLARRFLPTPPAPHDLAELLSRCFRDKRDATWLRDVDHGLIEALAAQLGDVWEPVRAGMVEAIALLTTRLSALGLTEDIRARSPVGAVRDSPFFRLPRAAPHELPDILAECRRHVDAIHQRLEDTGVSVDVVYCLDAIARGADRIELLLRVLGPPDRGAATIASMSLVAGLALARTQDRSLGDLMRANMRLLARKVIERAGQTGEHYITATRREYWKMLASAAGGGVLTAGTCVLKFLVKWGHYPLFVDGMLSALNYAGSFLLMQMLGFTLATKQPSMTAAALAGSIRESKDAHQLDDLVTMIARICRSQFAAAVGNIVMVIPAAVAFHLFYVSSTGRSFLDAKTAHAVVKSFHPTESGTIFYAALTGVLLWMSSLGAGWLENWAVYRRLPEAIEHHRAGRWLGRGTMAWLAHKLAHGISGFGGNVTLGFLLGMTPVMGAFFGLPLDVRHVTLSTGSLALAACALDPAFLGEAPFLWAALGVLCIGILNFGVSFALALSVALRARGVERRERFSLVGAVLRRFVRSPAEFFRPPRQA
jgi:site-specific recombinase